MTKMKSKKMTKSTFAIIIMAVAMVAMLAFGGTFAYFTATSYTATATTSTGLIQVGIGTDKIEVVKDNALPGETIIDTSITAINTESTRDSYIYAIFSVKFNGTEVAGDVAAKVISVAQVDQAWATISSGVYGIEAAAKTNPDAFTIKVEVNKDLQANMSETMTPGNTEDEDPSNDNPTFGYDETNNAGNFDVMNQSVVVTIQFKSIQKDSLPEGSTTLEAAYALIGSQGL